MYIPSWEDFSLTKKGAYEVLTKYFIFDHAKFGGKEMVSLNRGYDISSSLCEEASD